MTNETAFGILQNFPQMVRAMGFETANHLCHALGGKSVYISPQPAEHSTFADAMGTPDATRIAPLICLGHAGDFYIPKHNYARWAYMYDNNITLHGTTANEWVEYYHTTISTINRWRGDHVSNAMRARTRTLFDNWGE